MTIYTDTFGGSTVPPSEYGYQALTISADTTLTWPYNSTGGTSVSKIIDLDGTIASLSLTLPDAQQVSTGEDFLIRNVGANAVTVKHPSGSTVVSVASGAATYFYLTDNTTEDGVYGTIAYGVGTSSVDAGTLVGYGVIAIGATLNQAHDVTPSSAISITVDATYRSKVLVCTGGATTVSLTASATLGNNFFFLLRNGGSGVVTIDPSSSETIDGLSTLSLNPGDALLLFCSGTTWYSVGYGRSVTYNFTQLVKDVSAGGTITLSSTEANNKLLTFTGSPAANLTVVVPSVVAVYYILSSISTAYTITVKTAAGTGVDVPQSARVIAISDGTNVYSAQSVVATTSISLVNGSAATPALNFASQTNTGLYKYGTYGVGFAANGVSAGYFNELGCGITGNLTVGGSATFVSATFGSATFGSAVALPSGSTAVTPTPGDSSTKIATTAYADYADLVIAAAAAAATALKANIASPTFTGTVTIPVGASIAGYATLASPVFTGTPTAPTPTLLDDSTKIATTEFVNNVSFNSALPSQTGNAGKAVFTDGSNAYWGYATNDISNFALGII